MQSFITSRITYKRFTKTDFERLLSDNDQGLAEKYNYKNVYSLNRFGQWFRTNYANEFNKLYESFKERMELTKKGGLNYGSY